jgi:hypothetical protein
MPIGHTETMGKVFDADFIEQTVLDETRSSLSQPSARIDPGIPWCQLGTTAQARAKAGRFRRRGAREEQTVLSFGCLEVAYGTAVYPRRRDANEETPVESSVVSLEGPIAMGWIEMHGCILVASSCHGSPFSDIEIDIIGGASCYATASGG